jgi:FAD/FMN-containing dehydrogenase
MHGENNRRPAGEMIAPDDAGYDAARKVFNGMIDRRPALIVRCVSAADVAWTIRTARERGLTLSVYGGGHAVTGSAVCDSGLVVDLRGMNRSRSIRWRRPSARKAALPGANSMRRLRLMASS